MQKFLFFLYLVFTTTFAFSQTDSVFSLVREDDDIFIYERWITFPKSNPPIKAREVKGVFKTKATIQEAIDLLKDESRIRQWQSHVSKFKVYPQTDSSWFEYSYHDIPWPVSDQDHFLEYVIRKQKSGNEAFVTFESVLNAILGPVDEDAARMKLAGSWTFEKKKDH